LSAEAKASEAMKHGKEMYEKTDLAMKLVKAIYDNNFKQALETYTKLVNGEAKDGATKNEKVVAVKTTAVAKPKATGTAHNSNHNERTRGMCVSLITTDMDRKVCGQFTDKRFIYATVDRNSGRLLADAKSSKEGVCVFLKYNKDGKFDGCPSGAEKVQLSTTKMMCIKSLEKGKESHSSGGKYDDKKEYHKKETTTAEESSNPHKMMKMMAPNKETSTGSSSQKIGFMGFVGEDPFNDIGIGFISNKPSGSGSVSSDHKPKHDGKHARTGSEYTI